MKTRDLAWDSHKCMCSHMFNSSAASERLFQSLKTHLAISNIRHWEIMLKCHLCFSTITIRAFSLSMFCTFLWILWALILTRVAWTFEIVGNYRQIHDNNGFQCLEISKGIIDHFTNDVMVCAFFDVLVKTSAQEARISFYLKRMPSERDTIIVVLRTVFSKSSHQWNFSSFPLTQSSENGG